MFTGQDESQEQVPGTPRKITLTTPLEVSEQQEKELRELEEEVRRWQALSNQWKQNNVPAQERERLQHELQDSGERIWKLLDSRLHRLAQKWFWCGEMQDKYQTPESYPTIRVAIESLKQSLFFHILDALPKIKIDPNKNLFGLLLIIAHRKHATENNKIYRGNPYRKKLPAQSEVQPNEADGKVWNTEVNPLSTHPPHTKDNDLPDPLTLIPDPASSAPFEDLIETDFIQARWNDVKEFLEDLKPDHQWILQQRYLPTPPQEFSRIAEMRGPGWTEEAVRMEHYRAIHKIRQWLETEEIIRRRWDATVLLIQQYKSEEQNIIKLRFGQTPSMRFKIIAEQFTGQFKGGWTESMVRQLYHRVVRRIRRQLDSNE